MLWLRRRSLVDLEGDSEPDDDGHVLGPDLGGPGGVPVEQEADETINHAEAADPEPDEAVHQDVGEAAGGERVYDSSEK